MPGRVPPDNRISKFGLSISGHKTERMYLRYRQVRREEQEAALAKIAATEYSNGREQEDSRPFGVCL